MKVSLNELELKVQRDSNEDLIYNYQSIWPIYNLSTKNKKGMWNVFENKIMAIEDDLKDITKEELNLYFDNNPNIEFEIIVFNKKLPEIFFLNYKDQIFCYATSKLNKKLKPYIDVRFYFDILKFIND